MNSLLKLLIHYLKLGKLGKLNMVRNMELMMDGIDSLSSKVITKLLKNIIL